MDLKEQYEKLLRYSTMLTRDRVLAEDIVQETYLRFWTNRSYKDTGKELAYLYVIARNLCMEEFRRKKPLPLDDCSALYGDENDEPESRLDHLLLEEALDRLPEELREILVLRYMNGLSVGDVARVVGLSRFAVSRRLKEGLALLKNAIGGDHHDR